WRSELFTLSVGMVGLIRGQSLLIYKMPQKIGTIATEAQCH
ncbi:hypothetical protein SAMN03080606_00595, partial [Alkaliphilus peptidifermentans DSM 18978]